MQIAYQVLLLGRDFGLGHGDRLAAARPASVLDIA